MLITNGLVSINDEESLFAALQAVRDIANTMLSKRIDSLFILLLLVSSVPFIMRYYFSFFKSVRTLYKRLDSMDYETGAKNNVESQAQYQHNVCAV